MIIKLNKYQNVVPGARLQGNNQAALQAPSGNVKNSASYKLTQLALSGGKQLADEKVKQQLKIQEQQQSADLLDEANKYYEATRVFEHEYKLNHQGDAARNADKDFEEFHKKQYLEREKRFVGNARLSLMWQKQASQIEMSSRIRGMSYSDQQDKRYRADVTKVKTDLYYQKIAEAKDDKAVNNLRAQYNAEIAAINSPEQVKILMADADRDTAITRINTAIATDNIDEAKRLLAGYRKAGVIGKQTDEMVKKVELADVSHQAFQISQDIRMTMPDATKTAKLDELRKRVGDNQRVYQSARAQIIQDHSEETARKKEQNDTITDMFHAKIEAAKTPEERNAIKIEIMNTPMDSGLRTKLLEKNSKGLRQPLVSDDKKLQEVEQMVSDGTISQQELTRNYKYALSKDDFKEQSNRLKEIGGNRISSYNIHLANRLSYMLKGTAKKKKQNTKIFKDMMNQYIKEYRTQNGKVPSDEELLNHEKWLMGKVIYNENWYGDDTTERFLINQMSPEKFDVPSKVKSDIENQMREHGITPTDEQVIEIYKRYLLNENAR